ncbi:polysaccharide lyase [Echinicola jeungdonensis]|uniref:Polysaccharide lyase family 1 protein n=1 Tax=Echinicola jeungdonensis TaxID=709343 RepID=A0ABV5J3S4_9BACT|nr:polysaccharide lyase [Echinicola jeungdonensis]MDN3669352.1 polysaccharide lyase [Echinicola jeungdonensis]
MFLFNNSTQQKGLGLGLFLCLLGFQAFAQYPEIPEALQNETDAAMAAEEQRLEQVWENIYPTIEKEAAQGKPYIPWGSYPKDFEKAEIPAFPGAEGGGAYTLGGRGGKVFVVTNLADNGPGTLREACEAGGARTIVFNVAGIIHLETPISIRAPYVTIAGQTAPGDGVCVAGETFRVDTHDVIIRHMRFRRGQTDVTRRADALGGNPMGNVIIDHCSASWGLDENMSIYRNMFKPNENSDRKKLPTSNITIQNTISAEGLDTYNHAFGSTIGGLNSTFMRNLWANNVGRNPSVGMYGDFTFANNVLFNWWNRSVDGGDYRSMFNIINNYYKPGPITPEGDIRHRIIKPESGWLDPKTFGRAYVEGNIVEGFPEVSEDNWNGGVQPGDLKPEERQKHFAYMKQEEPFPTAPMTILPAKEAFEYVMENVGAILPVRDAVDKRVIKQVRTGEINAKEGMEMEVGSEFIHRRLPKDSYKKGIIMHPDQVGGYPDYQGEPYADEDEDGIPTAWEEKYGLDPNDPTDANGDINGDGYTNIEKYFNGIDPTKKVDWTEWENNEDTLLELAKTQSRLLQ